MCHLFFFFKQKTAYEMRISDWSSDVCSSDLMRPTTGPRFDWKSEVGEYLTWVRFVEEPVCHPMIALLAMGDALPPAAMALFTEFGPISSMNWTVNMLTGTPRTDDGWWLLSARTEIGRAHV